MNDDKTKVAEEKRDLQRSLDESQRRFDDVQKRHEALLKRFDGIENEQSMSLQKIHRLDKEGQKLEREMKNMLSKNNTLESQRE